MVADLDKYTRVVLMVNAALVLPLATVTLAGTLAEDELSLSDTTTPPLGAAPLKVTVPLELIPPVTVVGLSEREFSTTAGTTVIVTVAAGEVMLPSLAR